MLTTAGTQLRDRCRSILDLSRTGKFDRKPEALAPLIARSRLVLRTQLAEITVVETANVQPASCSGSMIEQILVNLLDNAAYAAGRGGTIWIEARDEGDLAVVEIRDSGAGVPPALRQRIFEPFYTTKPVGIGTGLGLSVSRRIALDHGGDLRIVARGDDTVFRLELPRQQRAS